MTAPYIIISLQLRVSSITYTINLLSESAPAIIVTSATGPIEILLWQLKDGYKEEGLLGIVLFRFLVNYYDFMVEIRTDLIQNKKFLFMSMYWAY